MQLKFIWLPSVGLTCFLVYIMKFYCQLFITTLQQITDCIDSLDDSNSYGLNLFTSNIIIVLSVLSVISLDKTVDVL